MTEKQAKDILDFLARKAGCVEVNIRSSNAGSIGIIGCISSNPTIFRALVVDHIFGGKSITSKDCSYIECLRQIFKLSRKGHVIKIYAWSNIFLKANANLDAILVEMDLSTSIE